MPTKLPAIVKSQGFIKSRKERANFIIEQKLDYAKLMVNENYSNKKIIAISGAGPSAFLTVLLSVW
jgi:transposase